MMSQISKLVTTPWRTSLDEIENHCSRFENQIFQWWKKKKRVMKMEKILPDMNIKLCKGFPPLCISQPLNYAKQNYV